MDIQGIFFEFLISNIELDNFEFLYSLYQTGVVPESLPIAILFCELGSCKKTYFDIDIADLEDYSSALKAIVPLSNSRYFQFGLETLRKCKESGNQQDKQGHLPTRFAIVFVQ